LLSLVWTARGLAEDHQLSKQAADRDAGQVIR